MTDRVIYSSDASIEDHANLVVFRNFDGLKEAIYIDRFDDTEQSFIYSVELFNKASDAWIEEKDLQGINSFSDTSFEWDKEFTEEEQIRFTEALCHYYGAVNFDSYPNEFLSQGSLEEWLVSRELIEKTEE